MMHSQLILHRQDLTLLHLAGGLFLLEVVVTQFIVARGVFFEVVLFEIVQYIVIQVLFDAGPIDAQKDAVLVNIDLLLTNRHAVDYLGNTHNFLRPEQYFVFVLGGHDSDISPILLIKEHTFLVFACIRWNFVDLLQLNDNST